MSTHRWSTHWPTMLGTLIIAASCALLKAPTELSPDGDLAELYEQGEFLPPDGTVTEGGTVGGTWEGTCEMYGYPYGLQLSLSDEDGRVTGSGSWITSWGEYSGTVTGERGDGRVEMELLVDYYGYDYSIYMEAAFEGATLSGGCDAFYGTGGYLELERT